MVCSAFSGIWRFGFWENYGVFYVSGRTSLSLPQWSTAGWHLTAPISVLSDAISHSQWNSLQAPVKDHCHIRIKREAFPRGGHRAGEQESRLTPERTVWGQQGRELPGSVLSVFGVLNHVALLTVGLLGVLSPSLKLFTFKRCLLLPASLKLYPSERKLFQENLTSDSPMWRQLLFVGLKCTP